METASPTLSVPTDHEQVLVVEGERSGATIAIGVHSTVLGPALGGCRLWRYPSDAEAVADARRLSAAMTLKAAAAGLDLGGGKGVINAPVDAPRGELRRALMLDFGDAVESLGGAYITAEDVGTNSADMAMIGERTLHVTGRDPADGGSGDPSPVTAHGVAAAMRACAEARFGSRSLHGRTICIAGFGHVGEYLASELAGEGAELLIADIRPELRERAERLGARWVEPEEALASECAILAPCALGGAISETTIEALRCAVICGAANNILADDRLAAELGGRGILYAPDFLANAGGIISVYGELVGYGQARAYERAGRIEDSMSRVLAEAEATGATPLECAQRLAAERLAAACETPLRG